MLLTATVLVCLALEVNISYSKLIVFNQVCISHSTFYHNAYLINTHLIEHVFIAKHPPHNVIKFRVVNFHGQTVPFILILIVCIFLTFTFWVHLRCVCHYHDITRQRVYNSPRQSQVTGEQHRIEPVCIFRCVCLFRCVCAQRTFTTTLSFKHFRQCFYFTYIVKNYVNYCSPLLVFQYIPL